MVETFGGEIKRIQWNNRLKTFYLSFYFLFGLLLFAVLITALFLIPFVLFGQADEYMKHVMEGRLHDIYRLVKPTVKIFIFVIAAYFYFLYSDMKNVGRFFGAYRMELNSGDAFYKILENFCIMRGLRVPDLYCISEEEGFIPAHFVTGAIVEDYTGKASLVITPAVYHLEKPLLEAFLAQAVQRIYTRDTLFLTRFCFLGYFSFHLLERSNPVFAAIAKPFLTVIDRILKPLREKILTMRFASLDAGAIELTKEKAPMDELLSQLTPLSDVQDFIYDPYLTLFIVQTDEEYRKVLLKRA